MLALWESKTSLQELKDDPRAIRAFIKSFRYFLKKRIWVESLDVTVYGDDGEINMSFQNGDLSLTTMTKIFKILF